MRKRTGRGKWRTHVLLTRKSTLENMNILILDTPVSWKMGQYHQNWHECVTAKRRIPPCKVSNQPNLSKRVRDNGKAKVFVVVSGIRETRQRFPWSQNQVHHQHFCIWSCPCTEQPLYDLNWTEANLKQKKQLSVWPGQLTCDPDIRQGPWKLIIWKRETQWRVTLYKVCKVLVA